MKNYNIHEIMSNKEIQKQFIKYLIVGGSSAALELLLFTVLRKVAGLSITASNVTAAVTSTAFNFLVNRGWSFKAASSFTRSLVLYLILFFSTQLSVLMQSHLWFQSEYLMYWQSS